jgi:FlaA1/EpsC-like NDP-sugar epimerase
MDETMMSTLNRQIAKLVPPVLALPRPAKRILVASLDASLCVLAVWIAYYLRLDQFIGFDGDGQWASGARWAAVVSVAIALPVFIVSGLYRAIFRYSGLPAFQTVGRAVGLYALLYVSVITVFGFAGVPRSVGIIQPMLLLLFIGASRAFGRVWLGEEYHGILQRASRPKVLIYGAGRSGRELAAAMANSHDMNIVGFLDDDDRLHGHVLNGLPIYRPDDLEALVAALGIRDLLLAMPGIGRDRRNEILDRVAKTPVAVRTVPSVSDLAHGRVTVADLRELDIDDLLGREPVMPNHLLLVRNVADKVVLVTGAGGSIGSELCRQILALDPAKLLLVDQSEFALYEIHQELESRLPDDQRVVLVPLLASVQDEARMREIMSTWRPETVYHAAAYKHVTIVEHNPVEGIRNNVVGTLRTVRAAIDHGVSDFVLISTDKAVRPTNVMGASKRLAEMILQALAATNPATKISVVRFGNVLGSSGSVVPKFRQQIHQGGPITLTHPDVTRYFMSTAEAAQLVIQAGAMARGGEVFVLDMGQPVRIVDLARRMIELSGLSVRDEHHPNGDIPIEITGLRPGEKLFEELLIGDEPQPTSHQRIIQARESFITWGKLESRLGKLVAALNVSDVRLVRSLLQGLVAGYVPTDEIVDWVYREQGVDKGRRPGDVHQDGRSAHVQQPDQVPEAGSARLAVRRG